MKTFKQATTFRITQQLQTPDVNASLKMVLVIYYHTAITDTANRDAYILAPNPEKIYCLVKPTSHKR